MGRSKTAKTEIMNWEIATSKKNRKDLKVIPPQIKGTYLRQAWKAGF